jgi:hypothetical protein
MVTATDTTPAQLRRRLRRRLMKELRREQSGRFYARLLLSRVRRVRLRNLLAEGIVGELTEAGLGGVARALLRLELALDDAVGDVVACED